MKFYSTKNKLQAYSLQEAVLMGLPPDNGLFMPEYIPQPGEAFFNSISGASMAEIAFEVSKAWFQEDIPGADLKQICEDAFPFDAPLVQLEERMAVMELFHGPTLAFKDFGARFMSRLMAWMVRGANRKLTILVATSGDTGSAVASGFYQVPGIEVIILYPSGKVSPLQEKQLTTWGGNILALEIKGNFDDCQAMVKAAFLDADLRERYQLSSANSINISRLIPQSFYYMRAAAQLPDQQLCFVVPSGNFGNLTAGLMAQRMGLKNVSFVAATNANKVVPDYLLSGAYLPMASVPTLSNAMDVGDPSNFWRLHALFDGDVNKMKAGFSAYSFTDPETQSEMKRVYADFAYTLDPHGAVAGLAWEKHRPKVPYQTGIILETAHPSKFIDVVETALGISPEIPERLAVMRDKKKEAVVLNAGYASLKNYLLS